MSSKITKNQEKILAQKIFIEKEEVSVLGLMNKIRNLMIEQLVNREAEVAYFYFFLTFFFTLSGFVVLWFLSTKFTTISEYFNDIFCKSRKYPNKSAKY